MRKTAFITIIILCLLAALPAGAELTLTAVPEVLRPGKVYSFQVQSPEDGSLTLTLTNEEGHEVYSVFTDYPITEGENTLHWDGLRTDYSIIEAGQYMLEMVLDDGTIIERPVRLGAPYPLLTHLQASDIEVSAQNPLEVSFQTSEGGVVDVQLRNTRGGPVQMLGTIEVGGGSQQLTWYGTETLQGGNAMPDGSYVLSFVLKTPNGMESMTHQVSINVVSETVEDVPEETAPEQEDTMMTTSSETPDAEETTPAETDEAAAQVDATGAPETTDAPTSEGEPSGEDVPTTEDETETEPTTPPSDAKSPPYSQVADDSFWSMTPGEVDDAVIWEIMTQPMTIYDAVEQKDHAYLMENEDGSGRQVAQIHGKSQGIHVIGEVNEHGYVLCEVFSSYDDVYTPKTDEEKEHAFELKQGYLKASNLKTIEVQQDMGLLIDKKTQRLYVFINGERVTELLISTGLIETEKYHNETTVGEFITVSHTGPFNTSKYMKSDMAIRINGGILIHEVPYEPLGDGSRRYSAYEALLGTKASHGCIRVQRKENEEGYNHTWLWDNLKHAAPYKVLIWDDANRVDTPQVWRENPS